jgi:SET domain-containing protein
MLKVKTIVLSSPIHGKGLFADEDISEGQIVWQFDPRFTLVIPRDNIEWISPEGRKLLRTEHYCWVDSHGNYRMPLDNDRFVNHSDVPNLSEPSDKLTVAARDIKKGEELTTDYRHLVPISLFSDYFHS